MMDEYSIVIAAVISVAIIGSLILILGVAYCAFRVPIPCVEPYVEEPAVDALPLYDSEWGAR